MNSILQSIGITAEQVRKATKQEPKKTKGPHRLRKARWEAQLSGMRFLQNEGFARLSMSAADAVRLNIDVSKKHTLLWDSSKSRLRLREHHPDEPERAGSKWRIHEGCGRMSIRSCRKLYTRGDYNVKFLGNNVQSADNYWEFTIHQSKSP